MDNIVRKAAIGAATIVGAKYLDAKFDISHDFNLVKASIIQSIGHVFLSSIANHNY